MRFDVVVYGTICLDAIWRVSELPPPGGYVDVLEERIAVGGEAANTAIALTRWGASVALTGNAIARDEDGLRLLELFASQAPEIDLQFVKILPHGKSPYCLCMATPDGQRTMIGRGFTDVVSTPLDPDLARSARFFTVEPNAYEAGLRACGVARDAGLTIIPMDYTRNADVNRMSKIVQTSTDHVGAAPINDLSRHAAAVRDEFGPTTVITAGERGCIVAAPGEIRRIPAYRAPEIVDSTGAGDVFRAGLLYGEIQGWDIWSSVEFASAAAALNCTALGGWGGVRSVAEIVKFQRTAERIEFGD